MNSQDKPEMTVMNDNNSDAKSNDTKFNSKKFLEENEHKIENIAGLISDLIQELATPKSKLKLLKSMSSKSH